MIKITTNKAINLKQLDQELNNHGLVMNEENPEAKVIGVAENSPVTKKELETAIENHVAEDWNAARIQKRAALLDKLGITEDEAKLLLS